MRLDGWKSIAAYFRRERTTVIRWSTERGMPVHRIPGTGRGSVYALTEELDAWLGASRPDTLQERSEQASPPPAAEAPVPARGRNWGRTVALSLLVAAVLGFTVYAQTKPDPPSGVAMPSDARAAAIYVEARAAWARRTPASILDAIDKLQRVVATEPGFASGYSALADSYLLAREFGSLPDVEAFSRAQVAVDTALKIDPEQASALRAKGFIDYWWRGERESAGRSFRHSLAIDSGSAQTHFWFANVLIDNGDFEEGMQRFAEAQLLEPGSPAIAADVAWARWSLGETRAAKAALLALRRDHPALATIPDYLSVIALAEGDVGAFVAEIETMAALRGEVGLKAQAGELRATLSQGPRAVADKVAEGALVEADQGVRRTLVWPAFVLSTTGDREALLRVLHKADARNEIWGSGGLLRYLTARAAGDAEVTELLRKRKPPPLLSGPELTPAGD